LKGGIPSTSIVKYLFKVICEPSEAIKMEDKIDIHGLERGYEVAIDSLMKDQGLDERSRELIIKFERDCKLGKTLKGKAKKKIGKSRIVKYIYILRIISRWIGKPFDEVGPEEMERLVSNIEENIFKKTKGNFSEETKLDFKKTLKNSTSGWARASWLNS